MKRKQIEQPYGHERENKAFFLEPFYGGSHRSVADTLTHHLPGQWELLHLPARHWKWHMRIAPVLFSNALKEKKPSLLFASSYLDLPLLLGLTPGLAQTPTILYFHENQFAYPTSDDQEVDLHLAFTQLIAALRADLVLFNSNFNKTTFIDKGMRFLKRMPKPKPAPQEWRNLLESKSRIAPPPLPLEGAPLRLEEEDRSLGPILLWPHRWEHDKGPDRLFKVLFELQRREVPFRLAVCGERFPRSPRVFEHASSQLSEEIVHWGFASSSRYQALLKEAHIAISTAEHEFFGIAMLEATHAGLYPLVPDRLAYPEIYPAQHRYPNDEALTNRLESLCKAWCKGEDLRKDRREICAPYLLPQALTPFQEAIDALLSRG